MAQDRFDSIIGQETAVAQLRSALRTGRISQAYIICGEKGTGKLPLAVAFASELGKETPESILSGNCPDIRIVTNEMAGATGVTQTIGVKVARFIQSDVAIRPYCGRRKIYIVPEAHHLNQQAQNALLKTLEEPPSYVVLLLLAETTAAFLPTVRSRCVTIPLRAAAETEMLRMLDREGVRGQEAVCIARLSHGNPGRALELSGSDELKAFRDRVAAFLKRMPDVNSFEIVRFADSLSGPEGTGSLEDFLDFGLSWYRDLLTAKAGAQECGLIFDDELQYICSTAKRIPYSALEEILTAFEEAGLRREAKTNDIQIAQALLLSIRRALQQSSGKR